MKAKSTPKENVDEAMKNLKENEIPNLLRNLEKYFINN